MVSMPAVKQHTTPDDGPSETETCCVVVEGHKIGVAEPGTAWTSAPKDYVCVHISSDKIV
jgi:hypothetical protein